MKFVRSTITTFLTNIFVFLISLLTTIVTARILGPSGRGIWGIANATIAFSMIIFGLGIPAANVYFIGKDRKNINSILGINFLIMLFAAFGLAILYMLNLKFNFSFFKGLYGWVLILVLATVPFMVIKTSLYNVFLGIEEVGKFNKITMLDRTISFGLLFVFIFIFRSAEWIIVSNFIAVCTMVLITSYILIVKKGYRIAINKETLKGMLKYGMKAQLGNLIQNINYRLDVFVTNMYLNPVAVGLYSSATSLAETMWKVSGSVGTVVWPVAANAKDRNKMTDFINKVIRVTFTFILICAIGLTAISKPLIIFALGKKFQGSVIPFMLIIPGISIFAINNILASYFAGSGLIEKNIIASTISGVITIILDFTLIPLMGISGASLTSSISYTVCTLISLYFYVKLTGSKLSDILIIRKSDIAEIKARLYKFRKVKVKGA
jgi:stage V sporulation protein B